MAESAKPSVQSRVMDLDQVSLENVLKNADKMVVVEFYMRGCEVCQQMIPIYEKMAEEMAETAVFIRVDADLNIALSVSLAISATPTFLFFCRMRPIGAWVGFICDTVLRNTINYMNEHRNECINKSTPVHYEMSGYS
jgi:thioredoxin-like negative regulator of GroEL